MLADGTRQRERLRGARRVAVPGCYPTISTLALAARVAAGLVEPDVVVVAASGTSGAGKAPKAHLLGSEVMGSASAYGVGGGHRHTPEIVQNLSGAAGRPVTVSFTPVLVPMSRGILATCSARLAGAVGGPAGSRPTTCGPRTSRPTPTSRSSHVLPEGQWPQTQSVLGSNAVHLQVAVDEAARRLVVVGAVDNLAKGTGGAAVQCLNLATGLDESGLATSGSRLTSTPAGPAFAPPMSVTHPAGFRAAGVGAGLKHSGGRDVALVVNDGPHHDSASVFTANRCLANPVLWSKEVVKDGVVRAVVLNSGGANCYTGPEGFQTTHATAERVAGHLGIGAGDVVVCSTGLIGAQQRPRAPARRRRRRPRGPGRPRRRGRRRSRS